MGEAKSETKNKKLLLLYTYILTYYFIIWYNYNIQGGINMEKYLLIPLLCCIILIIILFVILNKRTKTLEKTVIAKHDIEVARKEELKDYFKEEWDRQEKHLQDELIHHEKEIQLKRNALEKDYEHKGRELDLKLHNLESTLKEKEKRYEEVNQDLETYRKGKINEIDSAGAEYEKRKRLLIDASVVQYREVRGKLYNEELSAMEAHKNEMLEQIHQIKSELEEERTKRAAINEEIRRQREVEEQQDFYRIQLDPNDKDDVEILRSVAPRLRHPEAINKVIWTGYYQKPLAELRKRLLPNGDVSGVYKITRLKTNEIYIGQTTSVDKRWQEHVKSALGVGTLASSQLHRVMASDGCENFTFELLEVVPKDKLRERESYYIDFYDSKTYGLNSVTGDKNK